MEIIPCVSCGSLYIGDPGTPCPDCVGALTGLTYDLDRLVDGDALLRSRAIHEALDYITPPDEEMAREAEMLQGNLLKFVQTGWHVVEPGNPYVHGWHIGCICEHLEALSTLQLRSMVLNMPPRHAKSLLACVFWFCWTWASQPTTRWLFASYSDSLSIRDSIKCKDVIQSEWYQARWGNVFRLRRGEGAQGRFTNDHKGHRIATSVAGRGIGEGGDFLVADDPHKATDIYSETMRTKVLRWWSETMSTRGNNPATVRKLIIMQRLHERDLAGHVIASDLGYDHLVLPARYEPTRYFFTHFDLVEAAELGQTTTRDAIVLTQLQRNNEHLRDYRGTPGDPLWPERYPEGALRQLEKELEAVGTAGQLQQRPAPAEGDVFKRTSFRGFRVESLAFAGVIRSCFVIPDPDNPDVPPYVVPREWCRFFQTCDTAMKKAAHANYTAVLTCALAPVYDGGRLMGKFLLIYDVWREKLSIPEQYPALRRLRTQYPDLLIQYVEDKASGTGIIQQGHADGVPFGTLRPGTDDKAARAATVATLYRDGLVYHRDGMPGRADFEDELLSFPAGQYDDWVDCASYAGTVFVHDTILNAPLQRPLITGHDPEEVRREIIRSGQLIEVEGGAIAAFPPDDRPWWEPNHD